MPSYAPLALEAHTEELNAKLRLSTTIGLLERWQRLLEDPTAPTPTRAEAVQLIQHIAGRARKKLNSASAAVSDVESGSA
jgi:hypothetical protein